MQICSNRRVPHIVSLGFVVSPYQHGLQGALQEAARTKSILNWSSGHGFRAVLFWNNFVRICRDTFEQQKNIYICIYIDICIYRYIHFAPWATNWLCLMLDWMFSLLRLGAKPMVDASQMLPSSMSPSRWFLFHNSSSSVSFNDSSKRFTKKLFGGLRLGSFVWKPGIQHPSPNPTSHKLSQRVSIWSSYRVSE